MFHVTVLYNRYLIIIYRDIAVKKEILRYKLFGRFREYKLSILNNMSLKQHKFLKIGLKINFI